MQDYKRGSHTVWDCKYHIVKGKSSHKLLSEYRHLKKKYWGQHLWGRGYWVCSSGNVTDEVWKEYIKNQKPPHPDDDFEVV